MDSGGFGRGSGIRRSCGCGGVRKRSRRERRGLRELRSERIPRRSPRENPVRVSCGCAVRREQRRHRQRPRVQRRHERRVHSAHAHPRHAQLVIRKRLLFLNPSQERSDLIDGGFAEEEEIADVPELRAALFTEGRFPPTVKSAFQKDGTNPASQKPLSEQSPTDEAVLPCPWKDDARGSDFLRPREPYFSPHESVGAVQHRRDGGARFELEREDVGVRAVPPSSGSRCDHARGFVQIEQRLVDDRGRARDDGRG
mmetsp:Transcript_14546/g.47777  ORF Transcript_14546/g.47777 Transcript_14546/m.47777 type:complete len:255 (+) Transcript_14546:334-1098(+)